MPYCLHQGKQPRTREKQTIGKVGTSKMRAQSRMGEILVTPVVSLRPVAGSCQKLHEQHGTTVLQRRKALQSLTGSILLCNPILKSRAEAPGSQVAAFVSRPESPGASSSPAAAARFLKPCKASQVSCVSSSAVSAPSKYLPAWGYSGSMESAMKRLAEAILEQGGQIEESSENYLHAVIPYNGGFLSSGGSDDVEFLFADSDSIVTFRSIASESKAPQPFCITPGCVNGPPNRARMESLRDNLDWVSLETDEEKKWVQIMLH